MGKYVENNLNRNENIVHEAKRTGWCLFGTWAFGLLFCFLLFIPTIRAIIKTAQYFSIELAITNKRVIGKTGIVKTGTLDAPLNKVQNCAVQSGLGGKIFGYGTVVIDTAAGKFAFSGIKKPDSFKSILMGQIDQYEEDRIKQQAEEMAKAMAGVINK